MPKDITTKVDKDIRILIIAKSKNKIQTLLNEIKRKGYDPEYKIVSGYKSAAESAGKEKWDVIMADYKQYDEKLMDAISMIKKSNPIIPFIVVSDSIGEENAVSLIKEGADNYISRSKLSGEVSLMKGEI